RGVDVDEGRTTGAAPRKRPAAGRASPGAGDTRSRRYWYDGKRKRALHVDPDWIADFRSGVASATETGAAESGATESGAKESDSTRSDAKGASTRGPAAAPPAKAESTKRVSRRSPLER